MTTTNHPHPDPKTRPGPCWRLARALRRQADHLEAIEADVGITAVDVAEGIHTLAKRLDHLAALHVREAKRRRDRRGVPG